MDRRAVWTNVIFECLSDCPREPTALNVPEFAKSMLSSLASRGGAIAIQHV
jgi:hypothetical protein